ncbi:MAG: hypothetical protein MUQ65_13200 [Armatimonadetes bacterium]|nr:hypothetical protein [Armatimonadota bacterium]
MYVFSQEFLNDLATLVSSPGRFRFFVQPSMALFFAIRDGIADARQGAPPYLIHVLFDSEDRVKSLKTALRSAGKVFAFAIVLDAILQARILGQIHPLAAVVVGCLLVGLPYSLARGITNRIAQTRAAQRTDKP